MNIRFLLAFILCAGSAATSQAQPGGRPDQPDTPVDAATVERVIKGISTALQADYVFLETAKKMSTDLKTRLENKEYDTVASSKEFAKLLTEQLQAISKDKHLRVMYVSEPPPGSSRNGGRPSEAEQMKMRERMRARAASNNFGFEKVERLEGNVGYIDLRGFMPAEIGGETAAAAMNFVTNTDALIIDVRQNGGGAPSMVAFLCSYLFGPEPVHINDLYFRAENSTHQWWTLPYLPGKRYEGKPVYVLTSKRTFSAAEEFTYNLKTQKRATIVGETTGGGANPGGSRPVAEHFIIFVPSGRAINPITKTNWEGTGVTPDLPVAAELALKTAHLAALKKITGESSSDGKAASNSIDAERLHQLKKAIEKLEKELESSKVSAK